MPTFDDSRNVMERRDESSAGLIAPYTFGVGSLGITLKEVRGGTRVAIDTVNADSAAEALRVPAGGLIMSINGRSATGQRLAAVGKWLAQASRPLTLMVMQPNPKGREPEPEPELEPPAAASRARGGAQQQQQQQQQPERPRGPVATFTFGEGPMGLQLRDAEDRSGVIVGDVSAGSAASQQGVPVGGTLLRLNAIDLAGMSKAQVGKLLGKTGRPLTMQVAAPPPPPPVVMEHTFGAGPMGLALHDSDDGVSVRDVAGGSAAESMGIVAGSLLLPWLLKCL